MDSEAFDTKVDEYSERAKASWGQTPEWAEFERRDSDRDDRDRADLGRRLMALFVPFGRMAADGIDPRSREAQEQAALIQGFISEHFYTCSDETFAQLGRAYGAKGEFADNIDAAAGVGAAEFASRAVEWYCAKS